MNDKLNTVLDRIGNDFKEDIQVGSRHYIEVSIGKVAGQLGYTDLKEKYRGAFAIVPLKSPRHGMKVRIDGRTFVNYAEDDSGFAVPGFLARDVKRPFRTFVPLNSMICNFA